MERTALSQAQGKSFVSSVGGEGGEDMGTGRYDDTIINGQEGATKMLLVRFHPIDGFQPGT